MKATMLISGLFILMFGELKAQKNTLEISSGYTYFGTNDFNGANLNFSYQRKINTVINFYSQLNYSSGTLARNLETEVYDGYPYAIFYASNQVRKLNLGPSIKIFREKKHSLSIEPLVSVVQFKFLSTSGFIRNLNPNVPITSLYFGLPFSYREGYTLGFMGQLGYRFRLKNNLRLGIDTSLQNFKGDAEINLSTVISKSF